MKHTILFKDENKYASFPTVEYDGDTLLVNFLSAPVVDHCGVYDYVSIESKDNGKTWSKPHYYPSKQNTSAPREFYDSYVGELLDGTPYMTGSTGWSIRPKKDKKKLKKYGFIVFDHQTDKKSIIVGKQSLYFMYFPTKMKDYEGYRKQWTVPGISYITTFPRPLEVRKVILLPAYAITKDRKEKNLIWRSDNFGKHWELINMFPHNIAFGNEMAFVEISSKILALIRSDRVPNLMESWSGDYGKTWSYPLYTSIVGGPPHLLKIKDKILCTYGYRGESAFVNMEPNFNMGIRARISENGRDWGKEIILRYDGGTSSRLYKKTLFHQPKSGANDVGYPVSVVLNDGSIFTVYYITESDGITHIASTKWRLEEFKK